MPRLGHSQLPAWGVNVSWLNTVVRGYRPQCRTLRGMRYRITELGRRQREDTFHIRVQSNCGWPEGGYRQGMIQTGSAATAYLVWSEYSITRPATEAYQKYPGLEPQHCTVLQFQRHCHRHAGGGTYPACIRPRPEAVISGQPLFARGHSRMRVEEPTYGIYVLWNQPFPRQGSDRGLRR
jgi:hypothetical protein